MGKSTTGSGGTGAGESTRASTDIEPPPPRLSAAKVRKTIVTVLAPDNEMTPDEVRRAVATVLPPAAHASIGAQLRVLQDGDYVMTVEGDARKVKLTDSGRRWGRGIRALSGTTR